MVKSERGDTIIEILICVMILSLVMAVTFVSTSHSLHQGIAANSRQQASAYSAQEIEIIKNAVANLPAAVNKYESASTAFCIDPAQANTGPDYGYQMATSDTCKNFGNQNSVSMSMTYASGLFSLNPSWQGPSGSDTLAAYYRISDPSAFTPPAPPGPSTICTPWDPTASTGRRYYPFIGDFNRYDYLDTPPANCTWPANAYAGSYTMQGQYCLGRFEGQNGGNPQAPYDHFYALAINGQDMYEFQSQPVPWNVCTSWFDVPDSYAGGTVDYHDWTNCCTAPWPGDDTSGGTAFVGTVTLRLRYIPVP